MTKYKRTEFEDDEVSSTGSVPAETPALGPTRVIYHKGSDLWNGRSLLEKTLLVLSGLLVLVVIILAATVSVLSKAQPVHVLHIDHPTPPSPSTNNENYCLTPQCVTLASSIINAMDHTTNPCDDFYQYACGGWIKANPIPEGKASWSTFEKLWQENQLVMRNALEQPLNESASNAERKAKIYYLSCLDRNGTMEKLGGEPLLEVLAKVGGWSISGEFDINNWNFQSVLQTLLIEYNTGGLFTWLVAEDDKNSTNHILQIDQGGLSLPTAEYYLNKTDDDEVLVAFLKYMTQVGVLLGSEENSTREQMKKVIEFETKLATITIPADERRDDEKLYNKMSIANLTELAPVVDWLQYFNAAFKKTGRKIRGTDNIVVYAPGYLKNLSILLTEYLSTTEGKNIINNYFMWRMVRSFTPYLSKTFREASKILQKALMGSDGGEEQWRYCVTDTNNVIGFALGAMFVREVFHGESKPVAEEMIEEIRSAFKENLITFKWMDDETKKLAQEKADAITDMIGFPDYILNPKKLDEKYADLEFKEEGYFSNNLAVMQFSMKENLMRLDKPVNKTRWGMTPQTVNAYYTPTKNQIVFPAGILQTPFYDTNYPRSINFGGMGVVMGHELIHAFDDQGREYDKYGNLHQWWKNSTIESFNKHAQCIIDQYSNYTINGENINGRRGLGENIADNGGLRSAFRAYAKWASLNPEESPLPGVNLTHPQLFFIASSQVWCSHSTKENTHLQVMNDPHVPPKFRAWGPLSNSPEFAEHFKCKRGSTMNPVNKCELW